MAAMNTNMIEITCNDRLGKKVRVKCRPDDTIGANALFSQLTCREAIPLLYVYVQKQYTSTFTCTHTCTVLVHSGDVKKLVAAQTGTRPDKIVLKKWYNVFKDHITLGDYEIKARSWLRPSLYACTILSSLLLLLVMCY